MSTTKLLILAAITSARSEYVEPLHSRSQIRHVEPGANVGDKVLLAEILVKNKSKNDTILLFKFSVLHLQLWE
jgi:hypothetical protein